MISRRRLRAARGFTIIEVVIVLAILALIVAASIPVVEGMVRGEQLKTPARSLEAMAITARSNALAEQRLYWIVFSPDRFRLEHADADDEPLAVVDIPPGVRMEVASWPDEKWEIPNGRIWYFPATGLSEPLQVMFRKGDSYFSQTYGAVTGWERDSTSFIR